MSQAVTSLLIFGFIVVLFVWDKLPMATTAILGCVLMVVCGASNFSTVFGQFSSSTIVLMMGVMIIGATISETGMAKLIGEKVVKLSGNSEIRLMTATYLAAVVMSAFLTNSAVLAIFIPIIMGLPSSKDGFNEKQILMPITMGCVLGGAATLAGSTQQLVTQGYLETIGEKTFKMFDLTPVGAIIVVIGMVHCLTAGRSLGKKLWPSEKAEAENTADTAAPVARRKLWIIGLIFAFTVVFYITEWFPLAITSTIAALACIISGCITQKKAIQSINWNIIGRFGGYLGMAKALDASGGTEMIAGFFSRMIGDRISPFMLLVIVVLLTKLISEFMSPSAALLIVLPLVFSSVEKLGLNAYAYAIGVTFASSTALSTPLASTTLGMSMSVGYKFSDYFKYYFAFDVVSFFALLIIIPGIYGLTM